MLGKIPQEVYAALKEFGLTDYETRAFIALITNGISSAKELSDRTNIPYSRIYDVLVNLENIGWVNVISGRPMKYKAERPAYVAQLAKKQIQEKYERIEYALIEKLEPLYGHEEQVESTPIWILNGDVEKKVMDMILNTQRTLIIFMKNPNEKLLSRYFEQLLYLTGKKVEIHILLNGQNLKIKNKSIWRKIGSIAKVKVVKDVLFDAMVFDETDMLIFLTTFFKVNVEFENIIFLISEKRLLEYVKSYYRMLWSRGEKFSLRNFADPSSGDLS